MGFGSRRRLAAGFAVIAAALVMAGTAYGCTVYKGNVTITATGSGDTATAEGNSAGFHAYCSGGAPQTVDMNASNEFSISVAKTSAANCPNSQLPAATYQVRWVNMTGSNTALDAVRSYNCNVVASNVHTIGTITVGPNGSGTTSTPTISNPNGGPFGTATPPNGASGAVNLCVVLSGGTAASDSAPELALWVI